MSLTFATKMSQAACAVASAETLLHLTGLFVDGKIECEEYGCADDRNRTKVYTIRMVLSEALQDGD